MTEQEAFNNPEMKTILLLSGYVRELSEGADYETTTSKLAETLVKVSHVSQQRELLIAFFMHFRDKGERNIGMTIEEFVDDYISNL